MTTSDLISSASVAVSFSAILGCLVIIPAIYRMGASIQQELQIGVEDFR